MFIAAQARERLGFVMPGDIPYQVQLPANVGVPGAPGGEPGDGATRPSRGTRRCGTPSPMRRTVFRRATRWRRPPPVLRRRRPGPLPVVDAADLDAVARQLGREPRGVLEIAYRCPNGEPGVVKTAPRLPDGTPFPTLYYLTQPALTAAASRLESSGLMREMTDRLQQDRAAGGRLPEGARVLFGRA